MNVRIVEELIEGLETYLEEIEEGKHDPFYDCHIVDNLVSLHEILHQSGVEEGFKFTQHTVITDKPIELFTKVSIKRMLSGEEDVMMVMSIIDVKPTKTAGEMMATVLACKV